MSKTIRLVGLCIVALSLVAATPQFTPEVGVNTSTQNPLQIAVLHWYDANLTTTFGVGTAPEAIVFDGSSIWVANQSDNTVTKLRASDGFVLGTFSGGGTPTAMAYDGANLWIANPAANVLTKLRGSDGTVVGTVTVGSSPQQPVFDVTCPPEISPDEM